MFDWKLIVYPLMLAVFLGIAEIFFELRQDEKRWRKIRRMVGRIVFFKDKIKIYSSSSSSSTRLEKGTKS